MAFDRLARTAPRPIEFAGLSLVLIVFYLLLQPQVDVYGDYAYYANWAARDFTFGTTHFIVPALAVAVMHVLPPLGAYNSLRLVVAIFLTLQLWAATIFSGNVDRWPAHQLFRSDG